MSLTKTQAKGREQKSKYVESIRSALDEFEHVYVFSYENMRAGAFKDVRMDWRDSRYQLCRVNERLLIISSNLLEYFWGKILYLELLWVDHRKTNTKIT